MLNSMARSVKQPQLDRLRAASQIFFIFIFLIDTFLPICYTLTMLNISLQLN